jgi:hypothetical protein
MSSKLMPVRRRGDEARASGVVGTVVGIAARLVVGALPNRPILVTVSVDFVTGARVSGDLDVHWVHGSANKREPTDPAVQVHPYDEDTAVLRQSAHGRLNAHGLAGTPRAKFTSRR